MMVCSQLTHNAVDIMYLCSIVIALGFTSVLHTMSQAGSVVPLIVMLKNGSLERSVNVSVTVARGVIGKT